MSGGGRLPRIDYDPSKDLDAQGFVDDLDSTTQLAALDAINIYRDIPNKVPKEQRILWAMSELRDDLAEELDDDLLRKAAERQVNLGMFDIGSVRSRATYKARFKQDFALPRQIKMAKLYLADEREIYDQQLEKETIGGSANPEKDTVEKIIKLRDAKELAIQKVAGDVYAVKLEANGSPPKGAEIKTTKAGLESTWVGTKPATYSELRNELVHSHQRGELFQAIFPNLPDQSSATTKEDLLKFGWQEAAQESLELVALYDHVITTLEGIADTSGTPSPGEMKSNELIELLTDSKKATNRVRFIDVIEKAEVDDADPEIIIIDAAGINPPAKTLKLKREQYDALKIGLKIYSRSNVSDQVRELREAVKSAKDRYRAGLYAAETADLKENVGRDASMSWVESLSGTHIAIKTVYNYVAARELSLDSESATTPLEVISTADTAKRELLKLYDNGKTYRSDLEKHAKSSKLKELRESLTSDSIKELVKLASGDASNQEQFRELFAEIAAEEGGLEQIERILAVVYDDYSAKTLLAFEYYDDLSATNTEIRSLDEIKGKARGRRNGKNLDPYREIDLTKERARLREQLIRPLLLGLLRGDKDSSTPSQPSFSRVIDYANLDSGSSDTFLRILSLAGINSPKDIAVLERSSDTFDNRLAAEIKIAYKEIKLRSALDGSKPRLEFVKSGAISRPTSLDPFYSYLPDERSDYNSNVKPSFDNYEENRRRLQLALAGDPRLVNKLLDADIVGARDIVDGIGIIAGEEEVYLDQIVALVDVLADPRSPQTLKLWEKAVAKLVDHVEKVSQAGDDYDRSKRVTGSQWKELYAVLDNIKRLVPPDVGSGAGMLIVIEKAENNLKAVKPNRKDQLKDPFYNEFRKSKEFHLNNWYIVGRFIGNKAERFGRWVASGPRSIKRRQVKFGRVQRLERLRNRSEAQMRERNRDYVAFMSEIGDEFVEGLFTGQDQATIIADLKDPTNQKFQKLDKRYKAKLSSLIPTGQTFEQYVEDKLKSIEPEWLADQVAKRSKNPKKLMRDIELVVGTDVDTYFGDQAEAEAFAQRIAYQLERRYIDIHRAKSMIQADSGEERDKLRTLAGVERLVLDVEKMSKEGSQDVQDFLNKYGLLEVVKRRGIEIAIVYEGNVQELQKPILNIGVADDLKPDNLEQIGTDEYLKQFKIKVVDIVDSSIQSTVSSEQDSDGNVTLFDIKKTCATKSVVSDKKIIDQIGDPTNNVQKEAFLNKLSGYPATNQDFVEFRETYLYDDFGLATLDKLDRSLPKRIRDAQIAWEGEKVIPVVEALAGYTIDKSQLSERWQRWIAKGVGVLNAIPGPGMVLSFAVNKTARNVLEYRSSALEDSKKADDSNFFQRKFRGQANIIRGAADIHLVMAPQAVLGWNNPLFFLGKGLGVSLYQYLRLGGGLKVSRGGLFRAGAGSAVIGMILGEVSREGLRQIGVPGELTGNVANYVVRVAATNTVFDIWADRTWRTGLSNLTPEEMEAVARAERATRGVATSAVVLSAMGAPIAGDIAGQTVADFGDDVADFTENIPVVGAATEGVVNRGLDATGWVLGKTGIIDSVTEEKFTSQRLSLFNSSVYGELFDLREDMRDTSEFYSSMLGEIGLSVEGALDGVKVDVDDDGVRRLFDNNDTQAEIRGQGRVDRNFDGQTGIWESMNVFGWRDGGYETTDPDLTFTGLASSNGKPVVYSLENNSFFEDSNLDGKYNSNIEGNTQLSELFEVRSPRLGLSKDVLIEEGIIDPNLTNDPDQRLVLVEGYNAETNQVLDDPVAADSFGRPFEIYFDKAEGNYLLVPTGTGTGTFDPQIYVNGDDNVFSGTDFGLDRNDIDVIQPRQVQLYLDQVDGGTSLPLLVIDSAETSGDGGIGANAIALDPNTGNYVRSVPPLSNGQPIFSLMGNIVPGELTPLEMQSVNGNTILVGLSNDGSDLLFYDGEGDSSPVVAGNFDTLVDTAQTTTTTNGGAGNNTWDATQDDSNGPGDTDQLGGSNGISQFFNFLRSNFDGNGGDVNTEAVAEAAEETGMSGFQIGRIVSFFEGLTPTESQQVIRDLQTTLEADSTITGPGEVFNIFVDYFSSLDSGDAAANDVASAAEEVEVVELTPDSSPDNYLARETSNGGLEIFEDTDGNGTIDNDDELFFEIPATDMGEFRAVFNDVFNANGPVAVSVDDQGRIVLTTPGGQDSGETFFTNWTEVEYNDMNQEEQVNRIGMLLRTADINGDNTLGNDDIQIVQREVSQDTQEMLNSFLGEYEKEVVDKYGSGDLGVDQRDERLATGRALLASPELMQSALDTYNEISDIQIKTYGGDDQAGNLTRSEFMLALTENLANNPDYKDQPITSELIRSFGNDLNQRANSGDPSYYSTNNNLDRIDSVWGETLGKALSAMEANNSSRTDQIFILNGVEILPGTDQHDFILDMLQNSGNSDNNNVLSAQEVAQYMTRQNIDMENSPFVGIGESQNNNSANNNVGGTNWQELFDRESRQNFREALQAERFGQDNYIEFNVFKSGPDGTEYNWPFLMPFQLDPNGFIFGVGGFTFVENGEGGYGLNLHVPFVSVGLGDVPDRVKNTFDGILAPAGGLAVAAVAPFILFGTTRLVVNNLIVRPLGLLFGGLSRIFNRGN